MTNKAAVYNRRVLDPYMQLFAERYPGVDTTDILTYAGIMPWEMADQSHWFSQEQVNRFYERAVELTANPALAREAGQYAANQKTYGALRSYALSMIHPAKIFEKISHVISKMIRSATYESAQIGESAVEVTVTLREGMQEESYQCANRVGVFEAVLQSCNHKKPAIEHPECMFEGGRCCRYVITWQKSRFHHLTTVKNIFTLVLPIIAFCVGVVWPVTFLASVPTCLLVYFICDSLILKHDLNEKVIALNYLESMRDDLLQELDTNYNNTMLSSEIGQVISSQTTVDQVLDAVVKVLENRLDFDRGMILLADENKTRLSFRAGFGHIGEHRFLLERASFRLDNPDSRGVFVEAYKMSKPFLVDDFEEFERRHTSHSINVAKALGVKSFVCCPIICDNEAIGILAVDNLNTSRKLMESDKSLLMGIAPVIGVSIRNADLLLAKEQEFRSTLQVLAASIDARDPLTAGHSEKVTKYAVGICDEMRMGVEFRECVRVASLLHDYGKIGVPDSILKKDGRLTDEEYEIIKTHTDKTREILEQINFEGKYKDVPVIAGSHHEKWNGQGYPGGLKGKQIHQGARVVAVADFFEAITSLRHYREPMPTEVALTQVKNESGISFDPEVVSAFLRYYRRHYNGHSNGDGGAGGGDICQIRQTRVPMTSPARIRTEEKEATGSAHDVSVNGLYVGIGEDLCKGVEIKLEVMLPGQPHPLVARGRIAWTNHGENRPKPHYPEGYGVQLTTVDQGDEELINYLESHLPESGILH